MKIALVTGASAGMGREFVRQIADCAEYEQIWVTARRADRLEALKSELGDKIVPIPLDLCDKASFETLAEKLKAIGTKEGSYDYVSVFEIDKVLKDMTELRGA